MNKTRFAPQHYLLLGVLFIFFIADRASKFLAFKNFSENPSEDFLGFSLVAEYNSGAAFSIPFSRVVLTAVIVIVIILFSIVAVRTFFLNLWPVFFASALAALGAFSNLLDRMRHGAVLDVVNFASITSFNLSDLFIIIGVSMMILFYWRNKSFYARSPQNGNDRRD